MSPRAHPSEAPRATRPSGRYGPDDVSTLLSRLRGETSLVRVIERNAGTPLEGKPHPSGLFRAIRDGAVVPDRLNEYTGLPMSLLANDLDPPTVLGLSQALGVDVYTIRDAVAVSLGYPPRPARDPTAISRLRAVDGIELITPAESELLVAMARQIVAGKR